MKNLIFQETIYELHRDSLSQSRLLGWSIKEIKMPNPVGDLVQPHAQLTLTKQTATIFKAKTGNSSIFFLKNKLPRSDGPEVDATRLAGNKIDEEDLEKPVTSEALIVFELS